MLEVNAISKEFRGLKAIDDVSFDVPKGSITSLIGPNGAGKTTLINVITGVLAPTHGSVRLNDAALNGKRPHAIARSGVGRTFQTVRLFNGLTVQENLEIGQFKDLVRRGSFLSAIANTVSPMFLGDATGRARAQELMAMFDLTHLANEIATDLPYGTQRRVEIARALMGSPKLLLLDEPAAGMNEAETAKLVEDVRAIRASGVTVFLVEHDMSMVMSVSDKVVVLNFGKKIAEGSPEVVQKDPEVILSYLGDDSDHD
ncbi:ABC transporter ATP-binding protein [Variovorax sp. VNK109]|uniref:ABC transporter ATP-binding protein n=1 Tax=Variovorax sp. VNK109 TaxID=3400919 RepID=UPI003C02F2A7